MGGKKVKIDEAFMDKLLGGIARSPMAATAWSRAGLEEAPWAERRYDGRRKDDREDLVPHDLRREIRGLTHQRMDQPHRPQRPQYADMYVTALAGRSCAIT